MGLSVDNSAPEAGPSHGGLLAHSCALGLTAPSDRKLIGYENRLLAKADFNDDLKDGGELGQGHTVTALYEIVPAGVPLPADLQSNDGRPSVDPLVYQTASRPAGGSADLLTVKIRYKLPDRSASTLMTRAVRSGGVAPNVPFAAAVAELGRLLRDPSADRSRWDALAFRVNTLETAVNPVDQNDFATLVAMAADLQRARRE